MQTRPPARTCEIPFIGRQAEMETILAYLDDPQCRLLTLVGPGGVGKTRLAVAAAERVRFLSIEAESFADEVCFVSLAAPHTEESLIVAILQALENHLPSENPRPSELPMQQLIAALAGKRLLLILDNLETVQNSQSLLPEVLALVPELRILVTATRRLQLMEEYVYIVPDLSYPDQTPWVHPSRKQTGDDGHGSLPSSSEAEELFLYHVNRVQPAVRQNEETSRAARRICAQVQGLPLALELAASWAGMLSITRIADEIEQNSAPGLGLQLSGTPCCLYWAVRSGRLLVTAVH